VVPGDRWSGLPLTTGVVRGAAWVLREPAARLPDGFTRDTTVLVARSIDAGWITTLALVGAAVVETGGDLSHGSILVREIGLPAVTNVRGITRSVADGDHLEVDAATGTVRRIDG
jgi:pyruvate,water dikinase